jgi:selenide,water dikinase
MRIEGNRALVQTVDFFTPIVDDPELFGEISAANSISDIYAMGAEPILGLALAMFPTDVLPLEVLEGILRGGARKAAEAGFPIAGGHTIIDDIPKYGLAVTGLVDADKIVQNSTARVGDLIYLTKPIGNGILVSAYRAVTTRGTIGKLMHSDVAPDLDEATSWMTKLNRDAARAMLEAGATAATDVTGYGLVGHLLEMCKGASIGARIQVSAVPLLQNARELAGRGVAPAGTLRNGEAFQSAVDSAVSETEYRLMCDAQTSGGLLVAIAPERRSLFEESCRRRDVLAREIGVFIERPGIIELRA